MLTFHISLWDYFFPFLPKAYGKKRECVCAERRMTNTPSVWCVSPAWELTLNTRVISVLCLGLFTTLWNYRVLLACFQAVATNTSWGSSSIWVSSGWSTLPFTGPETEKNLVKRKTSRCLLFCGKTSAEALSCAGGTGRTAYCSCGQNQEIDSQERRSLWWVWSL